MKTVLYFTDAHAEHGVDDTHFNLLGELIVDRKPDVVVQGGDFCSVTSLSHWDQDKRKLMEMRRYTNDVEAARSAVLKMCGPLMQLQAKQRSAKEKLYRPELVWLEGNHEYWVHKYIDMHPELEGVLNIEYDVRIPYPLFSSVDYVHWRESGEPSAVSVEGVIFTHAPRTRTGTLASKYLASRALHEAFESDAVFGHTHRLTMDSVCRVDRSGNYVSRRAINGGCFFTTEPEYAKGNANDYWRGVLLLDVHDGHILDVETISLERMMTLYG